MSTEVIKEQINLVKHLSVMREDMRVFVSLTPPRASSVPSGVIVPSWRWRQ